MLRSRPLRAALCAGALVAAGAVAAAAQSGAGPLLTLGGDWIVVRYSPGALDRADHVQRRYRLLVQEFAPGKVRAPFVVDLLGPEEWRSSGLPEPYGLPLRTAVGTLAMPAWGTAGTVALWRGLLGGALPRVDGRPMRGTREESASLLAADLAGEVELARQILERQGVRGEAPWLDDLLRHALAVSAFRRYEESRWGEIRGLFAALERSQAGGSAPAGRLAPGRLFAAAARLADESGGTPSKPLLKMARKRDGVLLASDALRRFPWLAAWAPRQ